MLKKLLVNNRSIPVPVPLKNLDEAVTWIDKTLLKDEEVITQVVLDGRDFSEDGVAISDYKNHLLSGESNLEIRIDSPLELTNQSIETLRNLATVIEKELKPLAVTCWQTTPARVPANYQEVSADLKLMVELGEHIFSLSEPNTDLSILKYLIDKVSDTLIDLNGHSENRRWQEYARVLLNKLEPVIAGILEETSNLQVSIYSHMSDVAMCKGMK